MIGCIGVAPADGRRVDGHADLPDRRQHGPHRRAGRQHGLPAGPGAGCAAQRRRPARGDGPGRVDVRRHRDRRHGDAQRRPGQGPAHPRTAGRHRRRVGLRRPRRPGAGLDRHGVRVAVRGAWSTDHGWSREDAYVVLSALGHTELGGPTGSSDPTRCTRSAPSGRSPSPGSPRTCCSAAVAERSAHFRLLDGLGHACEARTRARNDHRAVENETRSWTGRRLVEQGMTQVTAVGP